jgi:hypothetical protein
MSDQLALRLDEALITARQAESQPDDRQLWLLDLS